MYWIVDSLLNNIDSVMNIAYNAFQRLIEIYKDNELDIETRCECIFYQQIALSVSLIICKLQKMLFYYIFLCSCIFHAFVSYHLMNLYVKFFMTPKAQSTLWRICFFQTSVRFNHILLNLLNISHVHLNRISATAQKYGLFGKYTDIGNGRYAYIWLNSCDYLSKILVILLSLKLKRIGYDVTKTNLVLE